MNADMAPYFETCPRCGEGGLEILKTHAFCINCNYEEFYSEEFLTIPQWALDVLKTVKPKSLVKEIHTQVAALDSAV